MVHVQRTFTVDKPVEQVMTYLADFANAEQWDPATQSCTRVGNHGPVRVGTTWDNVSKVLGRRTELRYTLEILEPGHLTLVGRNDEATSTDDITVTEHPEGACIRYDSDIELYGVAALLAIAAPATRRESERLGNRTVEALTCAIAAL